jgi:hypothetical protein
VQTDFCCVLIWHFVKKVRVIALSGCFRPACEGFGKALLILVTRLKLPNVTPTRHVPTRSPELTAEYFCVIIIAVL